MVKGEDPSPISFESENATLAPFWHTNIAFCAPFLLDRALRKCPFRAECWWPFSEPRAECVIRGSCKFRLEWKSTFGVVQMNHATRVTGPGNMIWTFVAKTNVQGCDEETRLFTSICMKWTSNSFHRLMLSGAETSNKTTPQLFLSGCFQADSDARSAAVTMQPSLQWL